MKTKYCKCRCGRKILVKPHHKYYGTPNYISGHNPQIFLNNEKRKGKSYEQLYGEKKAKEIKSNQSLKKKGKIHSGNFKIGEHRNINTEFKKGHKSWNTNLNKETNEIVKKVAESKVGNSRVDMLGEKNIAKRKEVRTKISKKAKINRTKQILPTKDTSIEIKIRNFLDALQIEYLQHKHININHAYQCDFFIPSKNLVIECDGDYWHKYPTGRDIDKIRTSELIEKGFKVLRLWEFEIKEMNLEEFKIIL